MLVIFGFTFAPTAMLSNLESQYDPLMQLPKNTHNIAVLGGGVRANAKFPPNTQLSTASLSRLIEGIRIYKMYQKQHVQETLILSGGRVFGEPAEAGVMQNIAVILGVNPKDIKLEAGSRDTQEEALYLKKTLGKQPFILVTSAYHMPRAMHLFESSGMHPIAAPTQYTTARQNKFNDNFPSASYLLMSDTAIHEDLGRIWAKIT